MIFLVEKKVEKIGLGTFDKFRKVRFRVANTELGEFQTYHATKHTMQQNRVYRVFKICARLRQFGFKAS